MEIEQDRIVGMYTDAGTICAKCMTEEDFTTLTREKAILDQDLEDPEDSMVCDDCGKRL